MSDPTVPDPLDLRTLLELVDSVSPVSTADALAQELGGCIGATEVRFWIVDYSGGSVVATDTVPGAPRELHPLGHRPLDEGAYGEALRSQEIQVIGTGPGVRLLAPVTNRGDSIGVLEMVLPVEPTDKVRSYVKTAAQVLAYVVVSNRQFTDLYEWGMRTTHFSLPAEIQRRLLPSAFSCETAFVTVAGWIEPAHSVAGDTFDYSFDQRRLQLSITDAMGHDLQGAMLATLLVGALRNGRRRGLGLAEQADEANQAMQLHAGAQRFVTGQVAQIDLETGEAMIVNAGHPPPLRLRDGELAMLELEVDLPFGLARSPYRSQRLGLEPGDRLVFVTDGMFEREAAPADIEEVIKQTADAHPRDAVHALTKAVAVAAGGSPRDDATVLCVDWHGPGPTNGRLR